MNEVFDPENPERYHVSSVEAQYFWDDYSKTDAIKATDYYQLLALYREAKKQAHTYKLAFEDVMETEFSSHPQHVSYYIDRAKSEISVK